MDRISTGTVSVVSVVRLPGRTGGGEGGPGRSSGLATSSGDGATWRAAFVVTVHVVRTARR
ncbi:hypothetical protein [Thermoactinospora rubra]|uniref:hypothetical protein n=1 Tax=Thermoactinospora rubra TaxID=1088767 RepID=UPI000A11DA64|nr:hypothetical protein [Thermoactinospora rubra]